MATSTKATTRERLLNLVQTNPTISGAELARRLGVSRIRVYQILWDEGYTSGWLKRA